MDLTILLTSLVDRKLYPFSHPAPLHMPDGDEEGPPMERTIIYMGLGVNAGGPVSLSEEKSSTRLWKNAFLNPCLYLKRPMPQQR